MKLLATRETYYAGKTYHAGETFEVLDKHVRTLRALKHCSVPPPTMEAIPVVPMTTENVPAIVPTRRGTYRRRDMQAEEPTPFSRMTQDEIDHYASSPPPDETG